MAFSGEGSRATCTSKVRVILDSTSGGTRKARRFHSGRDAVIAILIARVLLRGSVRFREEKNIVFRTKQQSHWNLS